MAIKYNHPNEVSFAHVEPRVYWVDEILTFHIIADNNQTHLFDIFTLNKFVMKFLLIKYSRHMKFVPMIYLFLSGATYMESHTLNFHVNFA